MKYSEYDLPGVKNPHMAQDISFSQAQAPPPHLSR